MTFTRTESALIGTTGAPSTIAANASSNGSLSLGSANTILEGTIGVRVIVGASVPTTNPTVQFAFSLDGSTYLADGGPFVVPMVTGSYDYLYFPPETAVSVQVTITNGATNSITTWAQGVTLGVS